MLMIERRRRIVEAIKGRNSTRVTELAEMFDVTAETIRRDLRKLMDDGKLLRSHGGAVAAEASGHEIHFSEREVSHAAEKGEIAREAVKLVREMDVLLMDASSTVLQMARLIPDIPLTVITNSMKIAVEFSKRRHVKTILTGGVLAEASMSLTGASSERFLDDFRGAKFFFSCNGIDLNGGVSELSTQQAEIKRKMLQRSDQHFLLVDSSKLDVHSLCQFASIDQINCIVTNMGADMGFVNRAKALGITVRVAGQFNVDADIRVKTKV